eukprot:3847519-Heterocapsa_arctica.AAC.1
MYAANRGTFQSSDDPGARLPSLRQPLEKGPPGERFPEVVPGAHRYVGFRAHPNSVFASGCFPPKAIQSLWGLVGAFRPMSLKPPAGGLKTL